MKSDAACKHFWFFLMLWRGCRIEECALCGSAREIPS